MHYSKKEKTLNQALALMSLSDVANIKEQSKRAEKCDLFWDSCLNEMLMRGDWNFARRKTKITNVAINNLDGTYSDSCQVELPNDYVHGIGLSCGNVGECCCKANNQVNFRRINSNLEIDFLSCCSCENQHNYMVYVANSFEPVEWQPIFAQAFIYCLAMKCIEVFRSDLEKKKDLQKDYEYYISLAIEADNKESNKLKYPIKNCSYEPFRKICNYRFM